MVHCLAVVVAVALPDTVAMAVQVQLLRSVLHMQAVVAVLVVAQLLMSFHILVVLVAPAILAIAHTVLLHLLLAEVVPVAQVV
jgi:hypothetical protein